MEYATALKSATNMHAYLSIHLLTSQHVAVLNALYNKIGLDASVHVTLKHSRRRSLATVQNQESENDLIASSMDQADDRVRREYHGSLTDIAVDPSLAHEWMAK